MYKNIHANNKMYHFNSLFKGMSHIYAYTYEPPLRVPGLKIISMCGVVIPVTCFFYRRLELRVGPF